MERIEAGGLLRITHVGTSEVVTVCLGPGAWLTEVTVGPLEGEAWPSRTRAAALDLHGRAVELCRGT